MAFPIIPKRRSGSPGNPTSLQLGELAVNTLNGELYLGGDGGVMLLTGPVVAGTTVTETVGDGSTTSFVFAGYNGTSDAGYLVSVGGIDQPPSKYSVTNIANGTLTFTDPPKVGEIISIRAIKGGGGTGDATSIQGTPVAETVPTTGQGLVYNGTAWAPGAANANATQLQSRPISATAPTAGQGLVFNGTSWAPATPEANATQIQSRNVANTAPTAGQVLAWSSANNQWQPTSLNGSVNFSAPGTYTWAVPAWVRWVYVSAVAGNGSDGTATNGQDGQQGISATAESPATTGANGADGTATPGIAGKSVTVAAINLALTGGAAGLEGLPGLGGGGSGGSSVDGFVYFPANGADGNGVDSGKGGSAAMLYTSNGIGGLSGGEPATNGGDGTMGGGAAGTGANGGGDGGYGAANNNPTGNGGGGGGGNYRAGGGGGGGAMYPYGTTGSYLSPGQPGKGGIADTSMCAGGAGETFNGPKDLSAFAGSIISISISEGAGNAGITITW